MRLKGLNSRGRRSSWRQKGGENFRDIDRRISKEEKVAVLRSADRGCIDHQGWPTAGTGRRNYVSSMQTLRPERGNRL